MPGRRDWPRDELKDWPRDELKDWLKDELRDWLKGTLRDELRGMPEDSLRAALVKAGRLSMIFWDVWVRSRKTFVCASKSSRMQIL